MMAAVHFISIPCEPSTADRHIEKAILFANFFLELTTLHVYARFEVFITFLCVFMSGFKIFVRYELWVNVPVAIFFGTVDCGSCAVKFRKKKSPESRDQISQLLANPESSDARSESYDHN